MRVVRITGYYNRRITIIVLSFIYTYMPEETTQEETTTKTFLEEQAEKVIEAVKLIDFEALKRKFKK